MTTVYFVKTGEQYLCIAEDGDVGYTPSIEEAAHFHSFEEAEEAAHDHADTGYQILIRQLQRAQPHRP
jgi:hypothetical protein